MDRLYDTKVGNDVLQAAEFDLALASARLLGQDIAGQLGRERARELEDRWPDDVRARLARDLGDQTIPSWPSDRGRRSAIIESLCSGTWG